MAKIFLTDKFHIAIAAGLDHIGEALTNIAAQGIDPVEILKDNFPVITDEAGDAYSSLQIGQDDTGAYIASVAEGAQLGSLAVVTLWDREAEIPQPTGEPFATPKSIYALSLPSLSELTSSPKLNAVVQGILSGAMLTSARKIAKADAAGTILLTTDRTQTALNAAVKASAIEKAYAVMFPTLQGVILLNVAKKAEALRAAGNTGAARNLEATFSKARLDKLTLKACLSSVSAAETMFPAMPQAQWENILNFAIAFAPKNMRKKAVTGTDGKSLKDEAGKVIYQTSPDPQSPAIFQQWKETRAQQAVDVDDTATFTFEGLTI